MRGDRDRVFYYDVAIDVCYFNEAVPSEDRVSPVTQALSRVAILLFMLGGISTTAAPIYPSDQQPNSNSSTLEERRRFTLYLMKTSPLPTNMPNASPALANPMDMENEFPLSVIGDQIYYIDLLASSMNRLAGPADIELPPGTMRSIDILDDLRSLYLSYDGRAFDSTVLDVGNAEIIEHRGLPVTTDGSPLSIGQFGVIVRERRYQKGDSSPARPQPDS